MSCGLPGATFSNIVLRMYHIFWGTVMRLQVAVSLKRAANHCTFLQVHILLWFISLQLCTENTAGRSSLMFGTYRQLSSQCYVHLIRQGYVVRWGGSACHSYQPKMSSQTSISS